MPPTSIGRPCVISTCDLLRRTAPFANSEDRPSCTIAKRTYRLSRWLMASISTVSTFRETRDDSGEVS